MARVFTNGSGEDIVTASAPSALQGAGSFTFTMWIKRDETASRCTVELYGGNINHFMLFGVGYNEDEFYVNHRNSGVRNYGSVAGWGNAGNWEHVAWVFDGSGATTTDKCKLYRNGVAETLTFSNPYTSSVVSSSLGAVHVGISTTAATQSDGSIAEVRIYPENFNLNQILMDMAGLMPTQPLFYQRLGVASPEPDWSGGGLNGTLTNSPTIGDHAPIRPYISNIILMPYVATAATVQLSGTNAISVTASGDLTGKASLSGTNAISVTASGDLTGTASLSGTNAISVTASGNLSTGLEKTVRIEDMSIVSPIAIKAKVL